MKHNNSEFKKFWHSLDTTERRVITTKAARHIYHVEQIAQGNRKMCPGTAFVLMDADKRITMEMCFPEKFE